MKYYQWRVYQPVCVPASSPMTLNDDASLSQGQDLCSSKLQKRSEFTSFFISLTKLTLIGTVFMEEIRYGLYLNEDYSKSL